MKILQVQFKNRNGHTLRGIVTLPDTEGKVPFVVHLHGFAGSCSGYKSMYTHLSRALAAQGIGRISLHGPLNSPMWTAKSCSSPARAWAATLPPPAHRSSSPTA